MEKNPVGWFEIPVSNMDRAIEFYEAVFNFKLQRHQMGDEDMAWFPWVENGMGASGSLVYHKGLYNPSADGVVIYFNTPSGDINKDLENIEKAGGKTIQPKTIITPEIGYLALFHDTEGNRLALHSRT